MITGGISYLVDHGLGVGTERATFKSVFDYILDKHDIKLHYASVLGRIWADQAEYQADLAAAIGAIDASAYEYRNTLSTLVQVVTTADRATSAGRWRAVNRLCRIVGEASLDDMAASPEWPIWVGIWAVAASRHHNDPADPVQHALHGAYDSMTDNFAIAYTWVVDVLGLRFKEPFTVRHFTIATTALAEGCALRDTVAREEVRDVTLPTGDGGTDESWTLYSIGLEALCHHFLEEIPGWEPQPIVLAS
jgi:hypothetical protein